MNFIKKNKIYIILGLIIFLGLFIRFLPIFTYLQERPGFREGVILHSDAKGYHDMALIFVDNGPEGILYKLNDIYKSAEIPYLTAFRTPAYPVFIYLVYSIYGIKPLLVLLCQIFLNVMTAFLMFEISVLIFKKNYLALLSAFLYIISPLAIIYSVSMYAESFFTFFFTLTIFSFFYAQKKKKLIYFVATGLLLGLTTLIKPITLYFLPIFFITLIFSEKFSIVNLRKKVIEFCLILFFFFLVLLPWQLRNYLLFNHYTISFQQGRELLVWRVGSCIAQSDNLDKELVWSRIQEPYLNIPDIFVRSKAQQAAAIKYIKDNPVKFARCSLNGAKNFFVTKKMANNLGIGEKHEFLESLSSVGMISNYFRHFEFNKQTVDIISKTYVKFLYLQYVIIVFGITLLLKNKQSKSFTIFGILSVLYFMLIAGVDGYFRYRYPVLPILIILTVSSAWSIFELFKKMWLRFRKKTD